MAANVESFEAFRWRRNATACHGTLPAKALLVAVSQFQFVLLVFGPRYREFVNMLLLVCAFGAFAALVPYAYKNETVVSRLTDISDTTSMLTYLIQVSIVGHETARRVANNRVIASLILIGKVLIALIVLLVIQNLVQVWSPRSSLTALDLLDNGFEYAGLALSVVLRIHSLIADLGLDGVRQTKKFEICAHLLLLTHEIPFLIVGSMSNYAWEAAHSLWNRVIIFMCITLLHLDKRHARESSGTLTNDGKHRVSLTKVAVTSLKRQRTLSSTRESSTVNKSISTRTTCLPWCASAIRNSEASESRKK